MHPKRLAAAVAATLVGTCLSIVTNVAPAAADGGFDVDRVNVTYKHSITSGSCRDIPVSLSWSSDYYVEDADADVEIWRGSRNVDSVLMFTDSRRRLAGDYYWCSFDGFGTFRAGPSRGEWYDQDYDSYGWYDSTTRTFAVKQGSRFVSLKSSKKGSVRTFSGKAQYFKASDYTDAWVGRSKGTKVSLQRLGSSGTWSTVKSTKTGARGSFSLKISASATRSYRIVSAGGATVWEGTSKTMRR